MTRASLKPPDTVVKLPNGETLILPRTGPEEATPAFRKYNPRKIQPKPGRKGGGGGGGASPFQRPRTVPFSKFLMLGFVLHQAVALVRSLVRKHRHRRALARGEEDLSEDESDSVASIEEEMQPKSELLPAMMRQAMPRPPRKNLARRRAEAHHSKPRSYTTAKQMRTPSSKVKQRQPGMLERMEKASREQVRAALLGQQRVADQLQLKYEAHRPQPKLQPATNGALRLIGSSAEQRQQEQQQQQQQQQQQEQEQQQEQQQEPEQQQEQQQEQEQEQGQLQPQPQPQLQQQEQQGQQQQQQLEQQSATPTVVATPLTEAGMQGAEQQVAMTEIHAALAPSVATPPLQKQEAPSELIHQTEH